MSVINISLNEFLCFMNDQDNPKNNNPRIQVNSMKEYKKIMDDLKFTNPKMMDIAVPANKKGLTLDQVKS